jgi:hypothetical protein
MKATPWPPRNRRKPTRKLSFERLGLEVRQARVPSIEEIRRQVLEVAGRLQGRSTRARPQDEGSLASPATAGTSGQSRNRRGATP